MYHSFCYRRALLTFLCLLPCFLLSSCKPPAKPITKSGFKLNTVVTITIYDSEDTSLLEGAMALCDYYENLLSRTRENSEIYRINQGSLRHLSTETAELLGIALSYSEASGGRLDPTIGAVSCLWDFHAQEPTLPDKQQISEALSRVDYHRVQLSGSTVTLEQKDILLDLGAVAKGYIADGIKEYLVEQGVTSAVIDLGGNILCIGSRPDGNPFQIGVRQPFTESDSILMEPLQIKDRSVVTSGIYERCFEVDGVLYHHLLDPDTGYPCDNELASVTIISDHSVDGDALSTACYLLGLEKGLSLVREQENVQAIFITKDNEIIYSEQMN